MADSRLSGGWAEQRALRLLSSRGWRLRSRNWRCRWGELDLLVEKGDRLLLVEVKGRRSGIDGWGVAALQRGKRQRLERAWQCWLLAHPQELERPVELVYALVPLPPRRGAVRWIRAGF
ncbi:MAG: YraN family protein [Cyanobacteria bacterium]|jgi:putative endonuclease|nr:YraN family protein [Cyanobacteriota bacterium]